MTDAAQSDHRFRCFRDKGCGCDVRADNNIGHVCGVRLPLRRCYCHLHRAPITRNHGHPAHDIQEAAEPVSMDPETIQIV